MAAQLHWAREFRRQFDAFTKPDPAPTDALGDKIARRWDAGEIKPVFEFPAEDVRGMSFVVSRVWSGGFEADAMQDGLPMKGCTMRWDNE